MLDMNLDVVANSLDAGKDLDLTDLEVEEIRKRKPLVP